MAAQPFGIKATTVNQERYFSPMQLRFARCCSGIVIALKSAGHPEFAQAGHAKGCNGPSSTPILDQKAASYESGLTAVPPPSPRAIFSLTRLLP
jgi:hypothetical protein